ncbi:hypothetical protein MZK49_26505 [Ensifer sesbaniae]|uniref:hypothetical protein n=1 Tax=Ensifer sesbaniae TaxID=1214071 RepID=UPI002000EA46|nr:hypothetical protein [Ensifer sesbaniae]
MYAETRCDEAELGWYEPSPDKFTFRGPYAKKISITPQLPQHFKNNFTPERVDFARKLAAGTSHAAIISILFT